MQNPVTRGAPFALAFLIALAASPASISKLEVHPPSVDLETHTATIELFNRGDKSIAAYTVQIREFDAAGKPLTSTVTDFDNLSAEPGDEAGLLQPGRAITLSHVTRPGTASVQASVLAVVNLDRTIEGDASAAAFVFKARARIAGQLKQAAALLSAAPATPQAARDVVQKIRDLHTSAVYPVLYEKLQIPAAVLGNDASPLTPATPISLDKQRWTEGARALNERAAFFQSQSEEVAQ